MPKTNNMNEYNSMRSKLLKAKEELRKFFRRRYRTFRIEGCSKGPWNLELDDQGKFYHSSSRGLCFEVGIRAGRDWCKDSPRWHQNALLVEASPVLYSELKNMISKFEKGETSAEDIHAAKKALELAQFDCEVEFTL